MKRLNSIQLIFCCILLIFSSCHHKKAENTQTNSILPSDSLTVSELPTFPARFGDWNSIEVPVQMSVTAPKKLSVSGKATFVKGREIYFSLRFFGIEVAQLFADPDSIFLVEKVHRWYIAESVDRLTGRTGLTLSDLQGLLLGRPERPAPIQSADSLEVIYDWDPSTQTLGGVGITRHGIPLAGILYSPAVETVTGPTSPEISLAAAVGKTELGGRIEYRLQQAKWNTEPATKFNRPNADYQRITIDQLAKNL